MSAIRMPCAVPIFLLIAVSSSGQLSIESPQLAELTEVPTFSFVNSIPLETSPNRDLSPFILAPELIDEAMKPAHFGIFCRIEARIEKKSRISPRFRLGSADYVDYLEGKRLWNEELGTGALQKP